MLISALLLLSFLTEPRGISVHTSGRQSPGYFLISGVYDDSVGLVDNSGRFLFGRQTGPTVNMQPTPSGGYSYFDGYLQAYVVVDSKFDPIDTVAVTSPYVTDFHEGYQTEDGRFILLGTETRVIDMSRVVPGGVPDATVIGAVVQELDRQRNLTFEWRSLDHVPVTESTIDVDITQIRIDYLHANTFVEDSDRNFLISCRNTDQIIKVDRATGTVLWRLGGSAALRSDFTFVNDTENGFSGFSHQHTPIVTRSGELMVFDNGNLKAQPFARVVAYKLDHTARTATKTWEYRPPKDVVVPTMGSVQELPNGNILIGWGTNSDRIVATEVDRSGKVHAELQAIQLPAYPYRVYKSITGMLAETRNMRDADSIYLRGSDTSIGLTLSAESFLQSEEITLERHGTSPIDCDFVINKPCMLFPERWMISSSSPPGNKYSMSIDLRHTIAERDPENITVYFRPREGAGLFSQIPTSTISFPSMLLVNDVVPGEYVVGSPLCVEPELLSPTNNAREIDNDSRLEWMRSLGATEYEVELSTTPDFSYETTFFRVEETSASVGNLHPSKTYFWRIRAISGQYAGPWTDPWMFTTGTLTSSEDMVDCDNYPIGTDILVSDVIGRTYSHTVVQQTGTDPLVGLRHGIFVVVARMPTGVVKRRVIYR